VGGLQGPEPQRKVPSRNDLAATITRLLKDLPELQHEEWAARSIRLAYNITNVGTAKAPKSMLTLRAKSGGKAAEVKAVNCPF